MKAAVKVRWTRQAEATQSPGSSVGSKHKRPKPSNKATWCKTYNISLRSLLMIRQQFLPPHLTGSLSSCRWPWRRWRGGWGRASWRPLSRTWRGWWWWWWKSWMRSNMTMSCSNLWCDDCFNILIHMIYVSYPILLTTVTALATSVN